MSPRKAEAEAQADREAITALTIPDDIRADLLREQGESVQTQQKLPRIQIMAAGAGFYEIENGGDPVRSFVGVILNNHPRNVLWDKKYADTEGLKDDEGQPACNSADGDWGVPRDGFRHPDLPDGKVGNGVLMVGCSKCTFNQFGSGDLLIADKNPKGKACTNQRAVYVMMEDFETPLELRLPPTSLAAFDEYLTKLLNKGIPVQSVVTRFSQVQKPRGTGKYSVATFEVERVLTPDEFQNVLTKRARYNKQMTPQVIAEAVITEALEDSEEEVPF